MEKKEAIRTIVMESRSEKVTQTGTKRLVTALRSLGFEGHELIYALSYLDVCRMDGKPYDERIVRTW